MASPRNEIRTLLRWGASLSQPEKEVMAVGCYICPSCPEGKRWFRLEPAGFEGDYRYTTSTRQMVLSLVIDHKMSFTGATNLAKSLLHLPDLADTTVLRWYREAGGKVDYRGHLERMASVFSGQLALDEVYDGGQYVLKATDPLNNLELSCWTGCGCPSSDDVAEALRELCRAGITPSVVVTDGSTIYPKAIAEVWPDAEHQLCVFHFMMGTIKKLHKAFWTAYNAMPAPKKRPRGRPKKRGRPRQDKRKRRNRSEVKRAHYLIFKRDGLDAGGDPRFTEEEQRVLDEALRLCPALVPLRRIMKHLFELFGPTTTTHQLAELRRQVILKDAEFADHDGMSSVLKNLRDDNLFAKLTRYLSFENADKTSNHVERENRDFRKRQRSHYRLRSIESLCAFLDLMLVRRDPPEVPRRLRRREPPALGNPSEEEVLAA